LVGAMQLLKKRGLRILEEVTGEDFNQEGVQDSKTKEAEGVETMAEEVAGVVITGVVSSMAGVISSTEVAAGEAPQIVMAIKGVTV